MQNIPRSVCFPNKQNFDNCAVRTIHTLLTWQLTVQVVWLYSDVEVNWHVYRTHKWLNHCLNHGIFLVNVMVPRALIMGCHMAHLHWLIVRKIICDSMGVKPVTSGLGECFGRVGILALPHCFL